MRILTQVAAIAAGVGIPVFLWIGGYPFVRSFFYPEHFALGLEESAMKLSLYLGAAFLLLACQSQAQENGSGGADGGNPESGRSPTSAGQTQPPPAWVKVTGEAAFSPRDTAEDLVFDGKMWLSNGYYHGGVLTRDLWSSTDGVNWTLVNPDTPYDGYSEMVVYDGKMWAIKGSAWHSTDGVNWTQASERTPFGARGYGELVVHDGRMWQLGSGQDVWHSTDGVNWMLATDDAPFGARAASAVAVFKNKLWLMGGWLSKANTPPEKGYPEYTTYNDVWSSADGANWTRVLEHAPWTPRMWFISKVYDEKMWIIGGYDNANAQNLGDVWHTEDGITWHRFTSETEFSPRHESTCYIYDNSLWVVAGNSWPVLNDAWRLTLPSSR